MHHCVNEGKLEALRPLLEKGGNPNVQDLDELLVFILPNPLKECLSL
ncbi:hypothetical protein LEP1GSC096_3821 [Leptospira interrogans serovar Hebdomadis str. R499]|nr:hypothetical protein LEP1GSC045_2637 [Leptospira interrogans serovar Pomona str. Kennewicki LC82-25]EKN96165.1 hypothetical protein LEP1GSC014_3133 [Leptospira interrogans serovar Pomona str. Pomona]EKR35764.1 hypothetical protein LEP1GSC096_3821 [Leptospira interrogans serovar Hebdomadis str. R499]EMF32572.1 hypothetical protein LEP1GSC201_1028 [Leptospira interrogans serovar Pomona str. Fox 32256]EMI63195.1 hypothetical protein LEP1GSC200_3778 [Leptospira interrogans serovar Pomona str. CS